MDFCGIVVGRIVFDDEFLFFFVSDEDGAVSDLAFVFEFDAFHKFRVEFFGEFYCYRGMRSGEVGDGGEDGEVVFDFFFGFGGGDLVAEDDVGDVLG